MQPLRAVTPVMMVLPIGAGKRLLATSPGWRGHPTLLTGPRPASERGSKTGCNAMPACNIGDGSRSSRNQMPVGKTLGL